MVDDHAELIAGGLRREGMAVDVASDGAQVLYNAQVHEYDVLVLDRDLPKLPGDEVTARSPRWPRCCRPVASGSIPAAGVRPATGGVWT